MIRTNEEKFNVSSLYDENMSEYTVPVPDCDDETKRKAAMLADDIEKKVSSNLHIAEERGQLGPVEMSEEDRLDGRGVSPHIACNEQAGPVPCYAEQQAYIT